MFAGKQVFYLIDEAESAGKGANSVVSMVDHYLTHYGHGEEDGQFHFDNCSRQNKNNVVLWYAMWRVMTGKFHYTVVHFISGSDVNMPCGLHVHVVLSVCKFMYVKLLLCLFNGNTLYFIQFT